MADDNPVTGGSDFSDWASETTQKEMKKLLEGKLKAYDAKKVEDLLKKIEENTRALKGKGAGGSGGSSGIDFTKYVKGLNLKGGAPSGGGGTSKSFVEKLMGYSPATATPGGTGGGGGPGRVDAVKSNEAKEAETEATEKSTSGLLNFGKSLSKGAMGMLSLVAIMGSLGRYVGKSIDGYRELMNTGQSFSGSLFEMRRQSSEAGMGFDSFTKIMGENSTLIKAVGNQSFIALQKGVRKANYQFGQFGFTIDETAQAVADYAEQQVISGRFESLSKKQQILETQQYMYEVTELSKITGKSRKQMMDDMKSNAKNVGIHTAAALLGAEGSTKFLEGMRKAGPMMTSMGSEMNDALVDLAAQTVQYGNIGMSEIGRVAAIVGGDFVDGANSWVSALKRGEAGNEGMGKMFESLARDGGKSITTIAQMARAGDEGGKSMMKLVVGFKNMSNKQKDALREQTSMSRVEFAIQMKGMKEKLDEEKRLSNLALNAQSAWRDAMGVVESMLIDIFAPAVKYIGIKLLDAANVVYDLWKKYSGDMSNMFGALMTSMRPVIDVFKDVYTQLKSTWSKLFDSLFKNMPMKSINDTINTISDSLSSVGKFLISFYKILDESGIIDGLGWVFGKIIKVVSGVAGVFATIFGGIFDVLGSFIDGIRRFIYILKNPTALLTMSSKEIDKELGIAEEVKKKDDKSISAVIPPTEYKEITRIKPDNIARIAKEVGATAEQIQTGNVSNQDQIEIAQMVSSGDETAIKILEQLEKQNALTQAAQVIRAEQLRQLKKKNSNFGMK